jgi:Na+/H+ antiporter NhaC
MHEFWKKLPAIIPLLLIAGSLALSQFEWEALSLLPSLVAILSVVLLRNALLGLLIGSFSGVVLLAKGNLAEAFIQFFNKHLIPALQSEWNLSVLIFTLLLGGFAALLEKGRGFEALLEKWMRDSKNSGQQVQWSAYFMGLLCFFDGLASSLLTGKSFRPLADRVGVSRAKLSYIVDSTSSAVACVSIMSTWIAYQLSMIKSGYSLAGKEDVQPFKVFLGSIPNNFYCWFTLILLAVVIRRNWNPGPMAQFETNGNQTGNLFHPATNSFGKQKGKVWHFLVPLLTLVGFLLIGLYWNGIGKEPILPVNFTRIKDAFGNAQSNLVLLYCTTLACLVAYICNNGSIHESGSSASEVFMEGVQRFFAPCLILISAWCLSSTLKELEASNYLISLLSDQMPVFLLPSMVFLLGVLISFTTGTSWGTMGVLMPLALPLTFALDPGNEGLVSAVVAAVFSGAVFGDHCSPLSDTTIVSSMACDIEPYDHVRTQLPYAILSAVLAVFLGFLPMGLGVPGIICLLAGGMVILLLPGMDRKFRKSPEVQ